MCTSKHETASNIARANTERRLKKLESLGYSDAADYARERREIGSMGIVEAYEMFQDGELSLSDLGEVLLEQGYDPTEVRQMLSKEAKYPIPHNYFGLEK